jgi:hypothetical protein
MKLKLILILPIIFLESFNIFGQIRNIQLDTINNRILFELYYGYQYTYLIESYVDSLWLPTQYSGGVAMKVVKEKYGGPPKEGFRTCSLYITDDLKGKTIRIIITKPKKYRTISEPIIILKY